MAGERPTSRPEGCPSGQVQRRARSLCSREHEVKPLGMSNMTDACTSPNLPGLSTTRKKATCTNKAIGTSRSTPDGERKSFADAVLQSVQFLIALRCRAVSLKARLHPSRGIL